MGRKDPQATSPTVEEHDPAAAGLVGPIGAMVSWHQEGGAVGLGTPGTSDDTPGGAGASAPLLRRVAQFVLLERLGAGGMGVVFAAFDEKLERKVAIKLVATAGDQRAQDRLLREAQAQGRLSHPNVVTVYEVGALPEGQLFIAMELVKGDTLRGWQSEKRTWQEVLARYVAAGEGLAAAHREGIVHRDFKPDNILLGEDGRVRVADFGLAFSATGATSAAGAAEPGAGRGGDSPVGQSGSRRGQSGPRPALTAVGTVAGTPGYMAPEQLAGEAVDARTDQFAFCVALFEALYEERPFADFALAAPDEAVLRRTEPDPAHPRWLWNVIMRGLSIRPAERFASMDELLAELTRNRDRTRRRLVAGAAALGVAVLAGVTVAMLAAQQGPPPCPLAEDELVGIWDEPARRGVQAALLGTGAAFAANVWSSMKSSLDQYSQRWLKEHQAACEATNVRHVQSAELLDRRMECLAGRKRSLAAAVEVFRLRPAQAVARAGEILGSLGDIELCADTGILLELGGRSGSGSAGARTPAQQAKLDAASTQLARARAFMVAGDLASAEADVAQASRISDELNDEHLRAELRFTEGLAKLGRGDVAESISSLDRAAELAVAGRHDELLVDIWLHLARDVGTRELRPAQIETWLGQAEAWIQRLNLTRDSRRFTAAAVRGNLQLTRSDARGAVTLLTRALETGEGLWGKDDPRLIPPLRDRAVAYARLRQPKEAIADGERALALSIAAYGAEHPAVARTRLAMGLLYIEQLGDVERGQEEVKLARKLFTSQLGDDTIEVANCEQALSLAGQYRGDYAAALEHAERAEQIYLHKLGAENPRRAEALVGVGVLRFMRKDFAGSLEAYLLAYSSMRATLGEDHLSVAVLHSNIGEALLTLGRSEDARVELTKALQVLEAKLGADHADLALPLKGLGLAHLDGNRAAEALTPLERALGLRTRSAAASDPQEVAEIRWALARTLRRLGRTPARARELATEARATYRTLGPEMVERVREISRWLGP